jgi:L-threonylcarbamoyladenylate synthase
MEKPLTGYLTESNLGDITRILRGGGVAVLPTDTVYGFHCIVDSHESVERIRSIKGRAGRAGFIMLASSISMTDRYISRWPFRSRNILEGLWPAEVTALLPAGGKVPSFLKPKDIVAVRVPRLRELTTLIERIGSPIVSTSVNITGGEPMRRIGEIKRIFPGLDAYIARRGRCPAFPSAIVDFTVEEPVLVRKGRKGVI